MNVPFQNENSVKFTLFHRITLLFACLPALKPDMFRSSGNTGQKKAETKAVRYPIPAIRISSAVNQSTVAFFD